MIKFNAIFSHFRVFHSQLLSNPILLNVLNVHGVEYYFKNQHKHSQIMNHHRLAISRHVQLRSRIVVSRI